MFIQTEPGLCIEEVQIGGHAQTITLRSYRPAVKRSAVPVILYFHGGSFTSGTLDDGDVAASFIARSTPAWVLSVGYSLAPRFPFPHATEDGYRALLWAIAHARAQRADPRRVGLAGHDAGGNLATCVAAIARDRSEVKIGAQALIAPLLDPSMTWLANESGLDAAFDIGACARGYADYLPGALQRLHPYAAPIESRRLWGLPPALVCSVQADQLREEAERYASALILAGVPTEVTRYRETSRQHIVSHETTLVDLVSFFRKRLGGERPVTNQERRDG
ncbi:alpha/beta hydrolase [Paraburkholderia unamae]|uniref:Acetyl esterase/lipase n=1 Tax=Paraburkholderia unamae TaxID=219649 RepID=A0ABX5KK89_9BURK|nr:alpha/beta hydrolase [Paraburkholderia unamae]PVX81853.1 acetyl esterase/lipase [Paraburkholderia unamae]